MDERKTILNLYEKYITEEMIPSKKYLELKLEFYQNYEILYKVLNQENRNKLDKLCEVLFEMEIEQGKNSFEKGYITGYNLTKEVRQKS